MYSISKKMTEILNLAQGIAGLVDLRIRMRALLPPAGQADGFRLIGQLGDLQIGPALPIRRQILENWPRHKGELERMIEEWLVEQLLPVLKLT